MVTDALTHFEQALALRPDFAFAHNSLGLALRDKPGSTKLELERARRAFERAIELLPSFTYAHENLFELLWFELEDTSAAFDASARAVEIIRDSSWLWRQYGNAALALPREHCADRARIAMDAMLLAIPLGDRRKPADLDTLAAACEELGLVELALSLQREAVQILGTESVDAFRQDIDVADEILSNELRMRARQR
jgi:tetratricopeptide (TPR) repeat protein